MSQLEQACVTSGLTDVELLDELERALDGVEETDDEVPVIELTRPLARRLIALARKGVAR